MKSDPARNHFVATQKLHTCIENYRNVLVDVVTLEAGIKVVLNDGEAGPIAAAIRERQNTRSAAPPKSSGVIFSMWGCPMGYLK